MVTLLLMIKTSYSQGLYITDEERDSAYAKIQRGKINAERVLLLNNALFACDSVKALNYKALGIQEMITDSLYLVNDKKDLMISNLKANVKDEKKRGRRKGMFGLFKGIGIGALGVLLLL